MFLAQVGVLISYFVVAVVVVYKQISKMGESAVGNLSKLGVRESGTLGVQFLLPSYTQNWHERKDYIR